MMYNQIECPVCGNETTAKLTEEPQKCKWCRKLFKIKISEKRKMGNKAKNIWYAEPVEFHNERPKIVNEKPKSKSISDWKYEDIFGKSK